MKIVNIDGKNLHIFITTWRIQTKFRRKMWLMIILKVTKKKQGFTLPLEDTFWKNHWSPSLLRVKQHPHQRQIDFLLRSLNRNFCKCMKFTIFSCNCHLVNTVFTSVYLCSVFNLMIYLRKYILSTYYYLMYLLDCY